MRLSEAMAVAFINTFGITQPTEAARRRAAWFIAGLLAFLLAGMCGAGVLIFHILGTSK